MLQHSFQLVLHAANLFCPLAAVGAVYPKHSLSQHPHLHFPASFLEASSLNSPCSKLPWNPFCTSPQVPHLALLTLFPITKKLSYFVFCYFSSWSFLTGKWRDTGIHPCKILNSTSAQAVNLKICKTQRKNFYFIGQCNKLTLFSNQDNWLNVFCPFLTS